MGISCDTLSRLREWWDSDWSNLELHDYFHEYYKNYTAWRIAKEADDYLERVSLRGRVLSIGCGYGLVEMTIALEDKSVTSLTGVDVNPEKISDMSRLSESLGLNNVRTLVGDGHRLPFRDGSFDSIFILATLSHVETEAPLLREAARLVAHEGSLCVVEDANAANILRYVWCIRMRQGGKWVERPVNPLRVVRVLEDAGFERVSVFPYTFKSDLPSRRRRVLASSEKLGLWGLPFSTGFVVVAEGRRV